jgi:hypothetical protein
MSFDTVTESEIMEWHRKQGGFGGRPAAHALRMLREMVELCIAAGANQLELDEAFYAEIAKAYDRQEFMKPHTLQQITEELVDVGLLAVVFRNYFIPTYTLENEMRRKLDVCKLKEWQPDADGVLWRPGTRPVSGTPLEPKSS